MTSERRQEHKKCLNDKSQVLRLLNTSRNFVYIERIMNQIKGTNFNDSKNSAQLQQCVYNDAIAIQCRIFQFDTQLSQDINELGPLPALAWVAL